MPSISVSPHIKTRVHTPLEIQEIQQRVVGMYSKHPWPSTREADEEMGWRLKMLGVKKEDFQGKRVLELGCGTGEYALWYAANGAKEVVGVDLSDGSLALANKKKEEAKIQNVQFIKKNILELDFPDNSFDYVYSVGVLHHTGDPYKGFQHLCRVVKPDGLVIVSLYNTYSRICLRAKQTICKWLGGKNIERRAKIGRILFPFTMYSLNKRYHESNYEQISYDIFGFPHESLHTAGEVLSWFDANNVEYKGSFAPLRLSDYFYAFSLPEYHKFKTTFAGFPMFRLTSSIMNKISTRNGKAKNIEVKHSFKRPGRFSMFMSQMIWFLFGTRFNCFTMSGRKRGKIGFAAILFSEPFHFFESLTTPFIA
jgi:ubiquinone/menaquinone biosynthesis C-methylase UbiE